MKVYVNGAWLEGDAPAVSAADRGLMLGDALFETVAVRAGQPRRVAAHLARLRAGAEELGIALAEDDDRLAALLAEAAETNGIDDGLVRLTLTRGAAAPGLAPDPSAAPSLIITGRRRPPSHGPLTAIIATVTRRNEHSPLARLKTANYLDNIIAAREARERGADEALLLNTAGRLAEATISNLFLVLDGRITTPPIGEGALPGVMRAAVLDTQEVDERPLGAEDLGRASEALLTNASGIRPLVLIDGKPVGDGAPGPVCRRLQEIV